MDAQKRKAARALRRKFRVRKGINGTPAMPRLSVHRTNLHIYAQLVDDTTGTTLVAAASNGKDVGLEYGGNVKGAIVVGQKLAEKAKAKGITQAAFDRGPYRFHGRVKALARAATDAGLKCTGPEEAAPKKAAPAKDAPKAKADKGGEGKKKDKEPAKA
jgi:large subunit ribosomal protein L18